MGYCQSTSWVVISKIRCQFTRSFRRRACRVLVGRAYAGAALQVAFTRLNLHKVRHETRTLSARFQYSPRSGGCSRRYRHAIGTSAASRNAQRARLWPEQAETSVAGRVRVRGQCRAHPAKFSVAQRVMPDQRDRDQEERIRHQAEGNLQCTQTGGSVRRGRIESKSGSRCVKRR